LLLITVNIQHCSGPAAGDSASAAWDSETSASEAEFSRFPPALRPWTVWWAHRTRTWLVRSRSESSGDVWLDWVKSGQSASWSRSTNKLSLSQSWVTGR